MPKWMARSRRSPSAEFGLAGREYEADIIVFATGFDAMTGPLKALNLRGRGGRSLDKEWARGPQTYLGLSVAGFPNLFTITGPQSPRPLQCAGLHRAACRVDHRLHCVDARSGKSTIEASAEAQQQWVQHVNEAIGGTLIPRANSWYMGANIEGKPRVPSAVP